MSTRETGYTGIYTKEASRKAIPLGRYTGIHTQEVYTTLYTPGYTYCTHGAGRYGYPRNRQCVVKTAWALSLRDSLGRGDSAQRCPPSCEEYSVTPRRVTPRLPVKPVKDWIDNGQPLQRQALGGYGRQLCYPVCYQIVGVVKVDNVAQTASSLLRNDINVAQTALP